MASSSVSSADNALVTALLSSSSSITTSTATTTPAAESLVDIVSPMQASEWASVAKALLFAYPSHHRLSVDQADGKGDDNTSDSPNSPSSSSGVEEDYDDGSTNVGDDVDDDVDYALSSHFDFSLTSGSFHNKSELNRRTHSRSKQPKQAQAVGVGAAGNLTKTRALVNKVTAAAATTPLWRQARLLKAAARLLEMNSTGDSDGNDGNDVSERKTSTSTISTISSSLVQEQHEQKQEEGEAEKQTKRLKRRANRLSALAQKAAQDEAKRRQRRQRLLEASQPHHATSSEEEGEGQSAVKIINVDNDHDDDDDDDHDDDDDDMEQQAIFQQQQQQLRRLQRLVQRQLEIKEAVVEQRLRHKGNHHQQQQQQQQVQQRQQVQRPEAGSVALLHFPGEAVCNEDRTVVQLQVGQTMRTTGPWFTPRSTPTQPAKPVNPGLYRGGMEVRLANMPRHGAVFVITYTYAESLYNPDPASIYRTVYLPDRPEARKVVALLMRAWDAGIPFAANDSLANTVQSKPAAISIHQQKAAARAGLDSRVIPHPAVISRLRQDLENLNLP